MLKWNKTSETSNMSLPTSDSSCFITTHITPNINHDLSLCIHVYQILIFRITRPYTLCYVVLSLRPTAQKSSRFFSESSIFIFVKILHKAKWKHTRKSIHLSSLFWYLICRKLQSSNQLYKDRYGLNKGSPFKCKFLFFKCPRTFFAKCIPLCYRTMCIKIYDL